MYFNRFLVLLEDLKALFLNTFDSIKKWLTKLWNRFKKWAIIRSKISRFLWKATFRQWKKNLKWLLKEIIYYCKYYIHVIKLDLKRRWISFYRFETLKTKYFWKWVAWISFILYIIYYKNYHDKFTYQVIGAIIWVIFFATCYGIWMAYLSKPEYLTRADLAFANTDETNLNVEYMPYRHEFDYGFIRKLFEPIDFNIFMQQILTFNFLIVLIFLFNINFFLKTKCKIKSLFSAIINLILIVILASIQGNEPIAYLFLVTELTGIVILSVIVLKQLKDDFEPNRTVLKKILITITLLVSLTIFFKSKSKTDLEEYIFFVTDYSIQNNNYNDLVSLFYTFIIDNSAFNTFIFIFLFLTILIVTSILFNKKYKKQNIKFNYLKKKITIVYRDINKKYKEYYNNLVTKFRNKK